MCNMTDGLKELQYKGKRFIFISVLLELAIEGCGWGL